MDKLNLDLNDLEVNSFQANPDQEEAQGTIHGNEDTEDTLDRCESELICATPGVSCAGTCETCGATCDDVTCSLYCSDLICPQ